MALEVNRKGERALWSEVIMQLINDYKGNCGEQAQYSAEMWLAGRTKEKDQIIFRSGIEPAYFWQEYERGFPNINGKRKKTTVHLPNYKHITRDVIIKCFDWTGMHFDHVCNYRHFPRPDSNFKEHGNLYRVTEVVTWAENNKYIIKLEG